MSVNSNLLEEYASVQAEIDALELKKSQLRPFIMEKMISDGVDKIEFALGKFSVSPKKTWTYTEKVTEMTDELKAQKAKEESTGEATFEESPQLRFTAAKL